MSSIKATLVFGSPAKDGSSGSATGYVGGSSSLASAPPAALGLVELDETIALEPAATMTPSGQAESQAGGRMSATQIRTTVLPRRNQAAEGLPAIALDLPRFHHVRKLGEGAIGTVELAKDNDIRRTVAVKKLRTDARSEGALLRFADEVRIVGQLEHPNIVPIYDVGCDEAGDVYLVMKHLEGETMEQVIEKLREGDPAYAARFPPSSRALLFLSVLDAMRYAHGRGIIHRDLKPANVMIGPFDEVTVLDWGIAKPVRAPDANAPSLESAKTWLGTSDQRLLETQMGMLAGTPLYMSPEQAAGLNDSLDERSDVYALSILFYEWLTLTHPLEGKTSLMEVLATTITQEHDPALLRKRAIDLGVPCEYVYLIKRGMRREREDRIQSVAIMYDELKAILEGRITVQCPVTLTKRVAHDTLGWADRHPYLFCGALATSALATLAGLGSLAWTAMRAAGLA
jgi:serine/threonine-protein kinase